ncbi:UNVERIFIED_CONTAM: hypothetical protein FKN15_017967 [Acipenser sinensis]
MGGRGKRLEEVAWCLHFTEVRHYQRESAPQRPPLQRKMERYESWLSYPSTPLWLRTEGRHLLGDSNLDILDFVRLEPEVQKKAITRGYPGLIEALDRMTQMVDWVYQEREERERKVRRRRQRGNTDLEWEEPVRPAPEWEEPERPAPEWEEPECPAPKREEPERPAPKGGESVRPAPKREESVRPAPKRGESVRPAPKRGDSSGQAVGNSCQENEKDEESTVRNGQSGSIADSGKAVSCKVQSEADDLSKDIGLLASKFVEFKDVANHLPPLNAYNNTTEQLAEIHQFRHNKRPKVQEQAVLLQGLEPPSASTVDPDPQPKPRPLLQQALTTTHQLPTEGAVPRGLPINNDTSRTTGKYQKRHNKRLKVQEQAVLLQGLEPPSASRVDPDPQPKPRPLLQQALTTTHQLLVTLDRDRDPDRESSRCPAQGAIWEEQRTAPDPEEASQPRFFLRGLGAKQCPLFRQGRTPFTWGGGPSCEATISSGTKRETIRKFRGFSHPNWRSLLKDGVPVNSGDQEAQCGALHKR